MSNLLNFITSVMVWTQFEYVPLQSLCPQYDGHRRWQNSYEVRLGRRLPLLVVIVNLTQSTITWGRCVSEESSRLGFLMGMSVGDYLDYTDWPSLKWVARLPGVGSWVCVRRKCAEHKHACIHPFTCSWLWYNVSSCSKLLLPWLPINDEL